MSDLKEIINFVILNSTKMKIFRKPYLSLFLAFLVLFVSCNQYEKDIVQEERMIESKYDQESHDKILKRLKIQIDDILLKQKPEALSLNEYKIRLIKGEYSLSESDKNQILNYTNDLERYGEFIATKEGFEFNEKNESELIAAGGLLSPKVLTFIKSKSNNLYAKMPSWAEIGACAAIAVGADILWSLSDASAKWTAKSLVKAFSKVAKRFLGPVGVAIAVVSFGVCIAEQSMD